MFPTELLLIKNRCSYRGKSEKGGFAFVGEAETTINQII